MFTCFSLKTMDFDVKHLKLLKLLVFEKAIGCPGCFLRSEGWVEQSVALSNDMKHLKLLKLLKSLESGNSWFFSRRMNLQEVQTARSREWKPVLRSKGLCREHFKLKQQDPENGNLYWGLRDSAVSTSSSRDQNYICGWKPVSWSSPWVAAEFFGKNVSG